MYMEEDKGGKSEAYSTQEDKNIHPGWYRSAWRQRRRRSRVPGRWWRRHRCESPGVKVNPGPVRASCSRAHCSSNSFVLDAQVTYDCWKQGTRKNASTACRASVLFVLSVLSRSTTSLGLDSLITHHSRNTITTRSLTLYGHLRDRLSRTAHITRSCTRSGPHLHRRWV